MGLRLAPIGAVLALAGAAPASADPVVLAEGHVDYAARIDGGRLGSFVKDGTRGGEPVWRAVADTVFEVRPAARVTIPRTGVLGRAGDTVWLIPQVQRAGVLWAGWNTEELDASVLSGPLTWTLAAVEGPGRVLLYQTGPFGDADVLFDSADGLPDARSVALGTHAHGNWAFASAGDYRLTFEWRGERPGGEAVSDTQTLAVKVDAPPPPPLDGSPQPGGGEAPDDPSAAPPALTVRASSADVRGRTLRLRLALSTRAAISLRVRHGGRLAARAKARSVAAGTRTLKVALDRTLKPGRRYRVRVEANAAGRTATHTTSLATKRASR